MCIREFESVRVPYAPSVNIHYVGEVAPNPAPVENFFKTKIMEKIDRIFNKIANVILIIILIIVAWFIMRPYIVGQMNLYEYYYKQSK